MKIKTIQRTKEMHKNARYVCMDKAKIIGQSYIKPMRSNDSWQLLDLSKYFDKLKIKPYCENWRKSLRKIVDKKPSKKDKEIARLKEEIKLKNIVIDGYVETIDNDLILIEEIKELRLNK